MEQSEPTTETVYQYILREEKEFQTGPGVPVVDGWDFKMHEHIRLTTLYKYGQLSTGKTDDKPVENIILPILNVAYRLEDINVKDIKIYVDDKNLFHKSFIIRKFHDRWARKFEIDTFLDNLKTSWIDFGLSLVKNRKNHPESVPLQRLAFCDQTDILSGPICEKHLFSPDQLQEMSGRWDADKIEEAIVLARAEKANSQVQGQKQKTPGKYIEVYELHGTFPEDWLKDDGDPYKYTKQIHIVTYYETENREQEGITLYKGPESKSIYDSSKRDEIHGRACGYGGGEELFEPQVWHTYSLIQLKEMLDIASLMIVKTTDAGLAKRQKITDLVKGEMLEVATGEDASQLELNPINWTAFKDWQNDRKLSAQTQGSANDPQLGVEPKSGTAMGLQRTTIQQGQGIHEYRKGIISTYVVRLYRNWFLQYLIDEINKGDEWMEELSLKELQWISEKVSNNRAEKKKINLILSGKTVEQADIDIYKQQVKEELLGEKEQFIGALKDEFKDVPIDIKVNIGDKQRNLQGEAGTIMDFIKAIISTGGAMLQYEGMDDLLNQVIEYMGLNPVDFSSIGQQQNQLTQPTQQAAPQQAAPQMAAAQ